MPQSCGNVKAFPSLSRDADSIQKVSITASPSQMGEHPEGAFLQRPAMEVSLYTINYLSFGTAWCVSIGIQNPLDPSFSVYAYHFFIL